MDAAKESLREAYGAVLEEIGSDINVAVVGADTTESLCTSGFGKKYPSRFFNVGIAEQNMVGISAGLALYGKTVFCGTYSVFMERAIDQIRNTIAYCNLDVKMVCSHAGISVGPDGGSHQTIEDIAIMRSIPRMSVMVPSDAYSTKMLVHQAYSTKGPFYIRLSRSSLPAQYRSGEMPIGKSNVIMEGSDISILACGIMVPEALAAAQELQKEGISSRVIDMYSIKPIDTAAILQAAKDTGRIITAEDHNIIGGLGSAVAETISTAHPVKLGMIGVKDRFGESGTPQELMAKYNISSLDIINMAKGMMQ